MKNAAESETQANEEEGVAEEAASLGPDGGPLVTLDDEGADQITDELESLLDPDDDAWLDGELTDEELAALSEEDFDAFDASLDEASRKLEDVANAAIEQSATPAPVEAPKADEMAATTQSSLQDDGDELDALLNETFGDEPVAPGGETKDSQTDTLPDFEPVAMEEPPIAPAEEEALASDLDQRNDAQSELPDTVLSELSAFAGGAEADDFSLDDKPIAAPEAQATSAQSEATQSDEPVEPTSPLGDAAPVLPPLSVANKNDAEPAEEETTAESLPAEVFDDEFLDDEIDHRPVPRISIHAFCETTRTSELLERAAVDRRLSKAHLTMHMGGIGKAVDQFQSSATPNLIVLETLANGEEIFNDLGRLAEVCDPSTKVVIIGEVNDIKLYRELIRQGISEYVVRPRSPLQIIKTIADLYVDPSAPPIGRTIAFVGSRGGVGSSSLAHSVAWCIAEDLLSDTVILDLDLPFGTTCLDFDQEAAAGLAEALTAPERLDDVLLERLLQKHTEHLSLFTAPSVLDRDDEIDEQAYETVVDVVRSVAPTIVIDVPHVWTNWSKRLLTTADEIVVTATPDLASFRNTKNLIDILNAGRPNDAAPKLVINQFDQKLSAVQADQFAEHVGIEPTQVLCWDPELFSQAATNAAPLTEIGPKTKIAQSIRELSAELIGRKEVAAPAPRFSLAGLFKKSK